MDFAQDQRKPTKHLIGIGSVILLHVGVVYGLANGLHHKVVQVISEPLKVETIEEVAPPPPPETPPPPPPKFDAPPPPTFIPPPEVSVTPPPVQSANAVNITPTTVKPAEFAPPPPPVAAVAPPAPAGPRTANRSSCSNFDEVRDGLADKFSALADKEGISSGEVTLLVTVAPSGEITQMAVRSATNQALARLAQSGVRRMKCTGQTTEVQYLVPFAFKLAD